MRPKDLKRPFTWEERAPLLVSQVLFVPEYYFEHEAYTLVPLHSPEIFGRDAPLFIEYCSGHGHWIIEQALSHPEYNWIAVEKRFDRVRKIWSKRENLGLKNLLIVSGEAHTFSRYYLPSLSCSGIYVNFPDPWPKDKHAKHRLFHSDFVGELSRIAQPHAQLLLVTDDPLWAERMAEAMHSHPSFQGPTVTHEYAGYGTSFFEKLFRSQGKTIYYIAFEKHHTQ